MKIKNMKIYNTIQNSGTTMHFLDQNLKIKNCKQLKHRNIMNEILWIYGSYKHVQPPMLSGKKSIASSTAVCFL